MVLCYAVRQIINNIESGAFVLRTPYGEQLTAFEHSLFTSTAHLFNCSPALFFARGKKYPQGEIKPPEEKSQQSDNKELTTLQTSVLATGLDKLLQKHPELATIIRAWPNLPPNIKATIMALIQTTT